jgi:hypothetical protein
MLFWAMSFLSPVDCATAENEIMHSRIIVERMEITPLWQRECNRNFWIAGVDRTSSVNL